MSRPIPELTVMTCALCPDPDALLLDWNLMIEHLRDVHDICVDTLRDRPEGHALMWLS